MPGQPAARSPQSKIGLRNHRASITCREYFGTTLRTSGITRLPPWLAGLLHHLDVDETDRKRRGAGRSDVAYVGSRFGGVVTPRHCPHGFRTRRCRPQRQRRIGRRAVSTGIQTRGASAANCAVSTRLRIHDCRRLAESQSGHGWSEDLRSCRSDRKDRRSSRSLPALDAQRGGHRVGESESLGSRQRRGRDLSDLYFRDRALRALRLVKEFRTRAASGRSADTVQWLFQRSPILPPSTRDASN